MKRVLVVLSLVVLAGVAVAWYMNRADYDTRRLPVINPSSVNDSLVDASLQNKGTGHRIRDFKLLNQLGETFTARQLEGKIYVTDFFFTTCRSICPKMTSQLQRVHARFRDDDRVRIVSHTVLPHIDSVPVLLEYAENYGADHHKWIFLTGDKQEIYDLARKSYFVVKEAAPGTGDEGEDFIHTENFVLIDTQKRIRGYYDGTSTEDVNRLMDDMDILLREKE